MDLLAGAGARSIKEIPFAPLFIEDLWPGLYTNRSALHDPSGLYERRYMGGRPGSLIGGQNVEITVRNTIGRRFGLTAFSTATYPTPPLRAFSFEDLTGLIRVLIDTGTTGVLVITSVASSSGATAVYTGTFANGGSNAYVGMVFQVSGFTTNANNGIFVCTASTTTTLTLANSQAISETKSAAAISSGAVYYDEQNGSTIFLKGKQPNATQSYFVAVAGVCYVGDGVETWVYTPNNTNGVTWNWGIVAPASQPSVTVVSSGSAAVSWAASTVWSTMGLIYITTGTGAGSVQQLISTNALGTNVTPQFNTTGAGGPNWNQTPGGTTTDGSIVWTNKGPIDPTWHANKFYNNGSTGGTAAAPSYVWDSVTQALYTIGDPSLAGGTTGFQYPHFIKIHNSPVWDNTAEWFWTGDTAVANGDPQVWKPSHSYPLFNNLSSTFIVEPIGISPSKGVPTSPAAFIQASSGGTSGTGGPPSFSTVPGTTTSDAADGSMTWMSLGLYTWAALHQYSAWSANGTPFSVIKDTNGNFQVCTTTGESGALIPTTWSTVYGGQTQDGSAVWTCVGTAMQWVASTAWFLPTPGFSPPSSSSPYGGAAVVDSNGDIEFVINSGKGGSSPPSWNAVGTTTTDSAATWFNLEVAQTQSLSWTKGYVYAYSFKSRNLVDFYSVNVQGTSTPPVPPGLSNPLPAPTGSLLGAVSTASPVFTINGANTGAVNTISGVGSTDLQVDTIVIWRSADGGGSGNMFELTEIPAPPPIHGIAQPWTFKDFLPDTPTSVFPGLNELVSAPIDEVNNPPLPSFLPMEYNYERIWGSSGQQVFFSGGPDTLVGNPQAAFNPADEFPFLSNVLRIVKTTQGSVVYTANSIEIILGGPATSSFFSVTLAPGIGLGNYNGLDVYMGEQFFMDATGQLQVVSPTLSVTAAGFPISDQLMKFNPKTVYITFADLPNDTGIYIGTGNTTYNGNTGWFRMAPRQIPGGINGPEPVWSPFAAITNGCQLLQAVEVTPGIRKLLVGPALAGEEILKRDPTVYTDDGTAFPANFQLGSLWLVRRGELAILKFLESDFSMNTNPTVSYLLNEISGTFNKFVTSQALYDPPVLYGKIKAPTSYVPLRFYFSSTGSLALAVHMQVGFDFGTTSNADECFNFTIYGAISKGH